MLRRASYAAASLAIVAASLSTACTSPSSPAPTVTQLAAGSAQCPHGGALVIVGSTQVPVCNGAPGAMRDPGQMGQMGQAGQMGLPGMNGMDGQQGMPGDAGPQGPPGDAGPPGQKGDPGMQGMPGMQGDAGVGLDKSLVYEVVSPPVFLPPSTMNGGKGFQVADCVAPHDLMLSGSCGVDPGGVVTSAQALNFNSLTSPTVWVCNAINTLNQANTVSVTARVYCVTLP
jgi:hypothetical protein